MDLLTYIQGHSRIPSCCTSIICWVEDWSQNGFSILSPSFSGVRRADVGPPFDVFCLHFGAAAFNNARPENSLHFLTISSFSLRIHLSFIVGKPVCYASPEPRSSMWDIEHWNQSSQQDRWYVFIGLQTSALCVWRKVVRDSRWVLQSKNCKHLWSVSRSLAIKIKSRNSDLECKHQGARLIIILMSDPTTARMIFPRSFKLNRFLPMFPKV